MIETLLIGVFAAVLLADVLAGLSVLYPLIFGFFLFTGYGLFRGYRLGQLLKEAGRGILTVKNILITFIFIGMLTGVWRSSGTIACIVYHASALCSPRFMTAACFILCAFLSVLTGTSFGTAATMGVICATMAAGMGIPAWLYGGAILAGSFYGDRCSPMSTSALLVAQLTETDIYTNIRNMIRSALLPTLLSVAIYIGAGLVTCGRGGQTDVTGILASGFDLSLPALIPAVVIVVLSLMKVSVRTAMGVSIITAAAVDLMVQHAGICGLFRTLVSGFSPQDPALAELMSGGGITSMLRVGAIVCISSGYSGIFSLTGFLDGIRSTIDRLCSRVGAFAGMVISSTLVSMISCSQTISIMLTDQLCAKAEPDNERRAVYMEDSVVIIAALIPWSIAAAVPLDTVAAPLTGIAGAVYLYVQPLWGLILYRRTGGEDKI